MPRYCWPAASGNDEVSGGEGDHVLDGFTEADTLYGTTLRGSGGGDNDIVNGEDDDDLFCGGRLNDDADGGSEVNGDAFIGAQPGRRVRDIHRRPVERRSALRQRMMSGLERPSAVRRLTLRWLVGGHARPHDGPQPDSLVDRGRAPRSVADMGRPFELAGPNDGWALARPARSDRRIGLAGGRDAVRARRLALSRGIRHRRSGVAFGGRGRLDGERRR